LEPVFFGGTRSTLGIWFVQPSATTVSVLSLVVMLRTCAVVGSMISSVSPAGTGPRGSLTPGRLLAGGGGPVISRACPPSAGPRDVTLGIEASARKAAARTDGGTGMSVIS
jgi:hypothetical protein